MTTGIDKLFVVFVAVVLPGLAYGLLAVQPLNNPANAFSNKDHSFLNIERHLKLLMNDEQEKQRTTRDNFSSIVTHNYLITTRGSVAYLNPSDTTTVDNSDLNTTLPLDIVVGDGSLLFEMYMLVLGAVLKQTQILIVIWKQSSSSQDPYDFTAAAAVVPDIAVYTVSLIRVIQASKKPIPSSALHLIAFGMGCHAAGVVTNTVSGIGVITGINPPALGFVDAPNHSKLDKGDADYVAIIHSSNLAIKKPMGDIDYYVVFGNSYNQHPYSTLRKFDHCYYKLGAIKYTMSAYKHILDPVEDISAYQCKSAKKLKSGKCLKNKVVPFGYLAKTAMSGKYFLQLDSFDMTFLNYITPVAYQAKYCKEIPSFVRPFAVQMWTSSPRNQGFIMANSYANVGFFNFTSTYKKILDSKNKSPGKVTSFLNVPLFVPIEDLKFQLRYSNRIKYGGNFTIDRIILTAKKGSRELRYSACNILLKPLEEPTRLDLVPGGNC